MVGATGWPVVEDLLLALGLFEDYPWVTIRGKSTIVVFQSPGEIGTPVELFKPQADQDRGFDCVELRWARAPTPLTKRPDRRKAFFPTEPPRTLDRFEVAEALRQFTGDTAVMDGTLRTQRYRTAWNGDLDVVASALAFISEAASHALPMGLQWSLSRALWADLDPKDAGDLTQTYLPLAFQHDGKDDDTAFATTTGVGAVFIEAKRLGWSHQTVAG